MENELLSMKQTTELVNEITKQFLERAHFFQYHVGTEHMKMLHYLSVLNVNIKELVVTTR